ncbi:MAG: flavin reductase [Rhodococcus sp. (in: high G+C Gram-positive bacteria)]|nr:MAG: flavin reductase [Rhodococcus sp. (in: high G+C Gram-positive bacteria)]
MSIDTDHRSSMSASEFRSAIGNFASGVTIVMTSDGDTDFGTTASAVCSLSADPPMLLVCLNRGSDTGGAVNRIGVLSVNILGEDQGTLASRFSAKGKNRFEGVELVRNGSGAPTLTDALASLSCRVVDRVEAGTHTVFHCAVESASVRDGSPLTYFRGRFGRFALPSTEELAGRIKSELSAYLGDVPVRVADLARHFDAQPAAVAEVIDALAGTGFLQPGPERDGTYYVTGPAVSAGTPADRAVSFPTHHPQRSHADV